jgi:hypothetical protein
MAQCASGAVISYSFWKHTFAGENSVIGKTLLMNRHPFEIVGVTPADFMVWKWGVTLMWLCAREPIIEANSQLHRADGWWLSMGRLKPGDHQAGRASVASISPKIFEATIPPTFNTDQAKHYSGYVPGIGLIRALRLCGVISKTPCGFSLVCGAGAADCFCQSRNSCLLERARAKKEMGMRMAEQPS